jgi:AAA+ ATPase superfamily predicted ATPase
VTNPFHYGAPATGEHFLGRRTELDALVTRMRSSINVVVMAPRRYGKTSLLLAAERRLTQGRPKAAVVSTNVFLCRDLTTLASRLVSATYHVPGARWGRARQGMTEFLRRLRIRPVVEIDDSGRPRFVFSTTLAAGDAEAVIADVFSLLTAAEDRPVALILDEFQAITRLGGHLPFLIKGLSDEHPGISLVLAGSQHHLMEHLVVGEGAPLYGMAQRLSLGPIPTEEWLPFLPRRAAAGGKTITDQGTRGILDLAGPVPNDIQHLAFEAFESAADVIGPAEVDEGMRRAVDHDSSLFAEKVSRLSPGQLRVLVALSSGEDDHIFTSAFARRVGLASAQSVRKAIDAMAEEETVVLRDRRWRVGDPFLASWVRRAN